MPTACTVQQGHAVGMSLRHFKIHQLKKTSITLRKSNRMPGNYPLPKFHFQVDWGGTRLGFTEVSGLEFETEVIEYREGSSKTYNKSKQPGLTKFSNVTLKRGVVIGDLEFFK